MGIYLKYVGAKSGAVTGGATETGNLGNITILSLELGLGHNIAPGTHLATGRQVVRPIVATKEIDKASPLLINSCYTNEVCTTCNFIYTRTDTEGQTKAFLTVSLKNATIIDYSHKATPTGMGVEQMTLNFTSFEFTWVEGGIMASVDMMAPT